MNISIFGFNIPIAPDNTYFQIFIWLTMVFTSWMFVLSHLLGSIYLEEGIFIIFLIIAVHPFILIFATIIIIPIIAWS